MYHYLCCFHERVGQISAAARDVESWRRDHLYYASPSRRHCGVDDAFKLMWLDAPLRDLGATTGELICHLSPNYRLDHNSYPSDLAGVFRGGGAGGGGKLNLGSAMLVDMIQ